MILLEYPYSHLFVCVLISIAYSIYSRIISGQYVFTFVPGAIFYISREYRDFEKLDFIDWPGIAYGVLIPLSLEIMLRIITFYYKKSS